MDSTEASEALGNMSLGAGTSILLIKYIEDHHTFFSIVVSLLGVILAGLFYLHSIYMKEKQHKFDKKRAELEELKMQAELEKFRAWKIECEKSQSNRL